LLHRFAGAGIQHIEECLGVVFDTSRRMRLMDRASRVPVKTLLKVFMFFPPGQQRD
jgi:hypothetical protein